MQAANALQSESLSASWTDADNVLSAAAFDRLYQETNAAIYRYAWVLCRDATVAEDITSEVFFRAWCNRGKFRGDGSPMSWLLSITYNTAMSYGRAMRKSDIVNVEVLEAMPDDSVELEGLAVALAESEQVHAAIRQLTPEQQQVIVLRFFEGMSHERVANVMERAPNAVRALQFRALRRLRTILEVEDDE